MDARHRTELTAWMKKLHEGDRAAARPVFDLLWPTLRAFARRTLGDADADDAAQQALSKIFAEVSRYDVTREALPWAFAITAWECRTTLRKHGRRREDGLVDDTHAAHTSSPELHVVAHEVEAELTRVLQTLSSIDRDTLMDVVTRTAPRDARAADATIRKRKQRALERLRTAWRSLT
jgi:RNA polymerase sigma-70 factor (ECF subfamily)